MPRNQVLVDDNFHYQDPDERWEQGVYASLYSYYTSFGEDPFLLVFDGVDPGAKFSAWTYAKERCGLLCGASE